MWESGSKIDSSQEDGPTLTEATSKENSRITNQEEKENGSSATEI